MFFMVYLFILFCGLFTVRMEFLKIVIYLEFVYFVLVFYFITHAVLSFDVVFIIIVFSASEGVFFFSMIIAYEKFFSFDGDLEE